MHRGHVCKEQVKVIGNDDVVQHSLYVLLRDSYQDVSNWQEARVGAKQCIHYELFDRLDHQISVDTEEAVSSDSTFFSVKLV
ncbi:hypothetical protein N7472_003182 [Penicillium cf. griseofulvum]|uniref:Uncharacterized protein n=1 Tax=Penicillium cf. griseofulvum TaxID=2972120 RepID=A0A9W9T284_9EURO|nr:hypothetical protein N7472_003182 [Penicillium cf. griseofulvum]